MVVHLTAAAHHIAQILIQISVTGPAGNLFFFKDVYVIPFHLAVAYEKTCRRQGAQA